MCESKLHQVIKAPVKQVCTNLHVRGGYSHLYLSLQTNSQCFDQFSPEVPQTCRQAYLRHLTNEC